MSKLNEVIFTDNLPQIDLHGYDRDSARVLVNDFIRDNHVMKNEIFLIIHGRGMGILKEEVHKTLKNNKLVVDYKTFYFNEGATIVQIKV